MCLLVALSLEALRDIGTFFRSGIGGAAAEACASKLSAFVILAARMRVNDDASRRASCICVEMISSKLPTPAFSAALDANTETFGELSGRFGGVLLAPALAMTSLVVVEVCSVTAVIVPELFLAVTLLDSLSILCRSGLLAGDTGSLCRAS